MGRGRKPMQPQGGTAQSCARCVTTFAGRQGSGDAETRVSARGGARCGTGGRASPRYRVCKYCEPMTNEAVVPFLPSGLPGVPPQPAGEWGRVLAAARRYKVVLAAITIAGTIAGFGASRFLKPTYQARATIWIQGADRDADRARGEQGPIQSEKLIGTPGGWLDLIRSHAVLDDVVREARLYLTIKSPADTTALTTLTAPGEVRPGKYRLAVDTAGAGITFGGLA